MNEHVHLMSNRAEQAGLVPCYPYNDCLISRLNVITLSAVEVRQMRHYKKGVLKT